MSRIYFSTIFIMLFLIQLVIAQTPQKDKGMFVEKENEFWEQIKKNNDTFAKGNKKRFILDFEGMDLPASKDEFTTWWHNGPVSQGNSGMCWCYCTTSFFESEIYRISGRKIKLSELHTVYWAYVDKVRRYVQKQGGSLVDQGSENNHVPIIWEQYGVVPADAYTGLEEGEPFHNHGPLIEELQAYLDYVKENWLWDENTVLTTVRTILNKHLGEPPSVITVDGKEMTPVEYFENVIKIDLDDYVDILSLLEKPYNEFVTYPVPDNWWNSKDYYNVDLDTFMAILKSALSNGYTLAIGGDVSEPGYNAHKDVAMVPTFDIPSDYIDENARQLRFSNKTTTDDHGIHVVGYMEKDGVNWYLIKDSGSGSRNCANKGYYFYHEDYIKLKMMDFVVHKDAVKGFLEF